MVVLPHHTEAELGESFGVVVGASGAVVNGPSNVVVVDAAGAVRVGGLIFEFVKVAADARDAVDARIPTTKRDPKNFLLDVRSKPEL